MANNMTVITQDHLETIRARVQPDAATAAQNDRTRRKELSDARAAKWPNTIEAQRARKEVLRQQAMEEAEAERCKEDQRRSRIKAEERKQQIERANKMLYDETDRVKMFNSKLLHSDVMQENEEQLEFKTHLTTMKKQMDNEFLAQQREALQVAEQAELNKMSERRRAALLQKEAQLAQLEETKRKLLEEREQKTIEGQMLMEAAEREKHKDIAAQMKVREEAQQRRLDTMRANDAIREYRRVQEERERLADEQIADYAARKAAMIEERKRRERERQAEKERRRSEMIAYMEANLEKERKKNEDLLDQHHKDSETKRAEDMADRNRRAAELQAAIDRSRQQQLDLKAQKGVRQREEDTAFAAAWSQRLKELEQEEQEERADRFNRNKHNQALLTHQIQKKAMKKKMSKEEELEDAFLAKMAMEEDDQMFDEYTTACLDEWGRQGKDTRPMTIHIGKTKNAEKKNLSATITNSFR